MMRRVPTFVLLAALAASAVAMAADKKYGPGVTDTEIKIGQTMPYSGPASGYASVGQTEQAYYKVLNAQGGVNGRKITLISLDDGYSPPKTVEQTRRLVESDQVLAIVGSLGTPSNTAIHKYLNGKKVPQLFISTGATKWGDPQHYPWTMGWQPNYQTEAHIFAKYVLAHVPAPKIGILYQNDDYGKDYVKGFRDGLGADAGKLIVKETSYEISDPTVDSQIVTLQGAGANVFFNVSTPKFSAMAIRKAYDIGWKPLHILNSVGSSTGAAIKPAGFERAQGIISAHYQKDATDPRWKDDKGMQDFVAFLTKNVPSVDPADSGSYNGYNIAMTFAQVLKQCGDDLTRENLMRQAANLHGLALPMLLPGITVNTSPTNFYPVNEMQLVRFEGSGWVLFGDVVSGS
ncbi:MAG TPA: ABC transporter substrate-binding protein [Candidatus Sulfotelmatobacter sp.]|nr:ABC transporter substrate-binding protein [Candidatus Sulfotelmatobacter sp.]